MGLLGTTKTDRGHTGITLFLTLSVWRWSTTQLYLCSFSFSLTLLIVLCCLCFSFTSHQWLRSYGDGTSVKSLNRRTGGTGIETTTPGLQGEWSIHHTMAANCIWNLIFFLRRILREIFWCSGSCTFWSLVVHRRFAFLFIDSYTLLERPWRSCSVLRGLIVIIFFSMGLSTFSLVNYSLILCFWNLSCPVNW